MSNKYANLPSYLVFEGMGEDADGKPVMRVRLAWWAVPIRAFNKAWGRLRGGAA